MVRHGVSANVISDRLGHRGVVFTLRIFAHLFEDQRCEATIPIHDFLGMTVTVLEELTRPKTIPARILNRVYCDIWAFPGHQQRDGFV
jgi:integrase